MPSRSRSESAQYQSLNICSSEQRRWVSEGVSAWGRVRLPLMARLARQPACPPASPWPAPPPPSRLVSNLSPQRHALQNIRVLPLVAVRQARAGRAALRVCGAIGAGGGRCWARGVRCAVPLAGAACFRACTAPSLWSRQPDGRHAIKPSKKQAQMGCPTHPPGWPGCSLAPPSRAGSRRAGSQSCCGWWEGRGRQAGGGAEGRTACKPNTHRRSAGRRRPRRPCLAASLPHRSTGSRLNSRYLRQVAGGGGTAD